MTMPGPQPDDVHTAFEEDRTRRAFERGSAVLRAARSGDERIFRLFAALTEEGLLDLLTTELPRLRRRTASVTARILGDPRWQHKWDSSLPAPPDDDTLDTLIGATTQLLYGGRCSPLTKLWSMCVYGIEDWVDHRVFSGDCVVFCRCVPAVLARGEVSRRSLEQSLLEDAPTSGLSFVRYEVDVHVEMVMEASARMTQLMETLDEIWTKEN